MANVIVGPQRPVPDNSILTQALHQYIQNSAARTRQEEENKQQAEQERQNRAAASARAVLAAMPQDQQQEYMRKHAAELGIGDMSDIAPHVKTPEELYNATRATKNREAIEGFRPDQFQAPYIATDLLTGRSPNAEYTKNIADKAYLPPDQFNASQRIGAGLQMNARDAVVAPTEANRNTSAARKDDADAAFTSGPRTALTRAEIGKTSAETGKLGAETKRIGAETAGMQATTAMNPQGVGEGGEAFLKTLPPGYQQIVKGLTSYTLPLEKIASLRQGSGPKGESERLMLLRYATQYDPTFDMTQYPARAATRKDFNAGKAANNIRSINTAIHHLAKWVEAGEQLTQTRFKAINSVGNFLSDAAGGSARNNSEMAGHRVGEELINAFKGASGTVPDLKDINNQLASNLSPTQRRDVAREVVEMLHGRLMTLDDQYRMAMGKPGDFVTLTPASRAVLQKKLGINPDDLEGSGAALAPSGASAAPPAGQGAKTVTITELRAMGSTPEEAKAEGYTVIP